MDHIYHTDRAERLQMQESPSNILQQFTHIQQAQKIP